MEEVLDILWLKIVAGVHLASRGMDRLLEPLAFLGPALLIFFLALFTVCATKFFSRIYTTKRYKELKKEFFHWHGLRQEALKWKDTEKGKTLAKNIDQAQLNRVYYDFFFEGLLSKILTVYLPFLIMAAYVNEAFRPEVLMEKFGQTHVYRYSGFLGGDPATLGAVFWFVLLLLGIHLGWFIISKSIGRKKPAPSSTIVTKPTSDQA